jgi:hypothetical protein
MHNNIQLEMNSPICMNLETEIPYKLFLVFLFVIIFYSLNTFLSFYKKYIVLIADVYTML